MSPLFPFARLPGQTTGDFAIARAQQITTELPQIHAPHALRAHHLLLEADSLQTVLIFPALGTFTAPMPPHRVYPARPHLTTQ